ncbi:hypothetical protein OOT46_17705 [Aquabacterium sp. A7-Y]|uniref:hypothetical protein n=1 Tax=Aquabacterium sp. A7-Y TaxID=1349605 RepID=UPI00223DA697|nr:hypothetical protein [Aquabacterium sp. A7-Y]MCW7539676.1 hypothetical protein [Aquabacterium sp. A7-Y]
MWLARALARLRAALRLQARRPEVPTPPSDLQPWVQDAARVLLGDDVRAPALAVWLKRGLRDASGRYVCLQGHLGTPSYVVDLQRRCCWVDADGSALYFDATCLTLEGDETRFEAFPLHADTYTVDLQAAELSWQPCPHQRARQEYARAALDPISHPPGDAKPAHTAPK